MIIVTCGPLEFEFEFLCRAFPSESVSMEAQCYLDLHRGMNPKGWMMHPSNWTLGRIKVSYGGT
jgi:hypothetical protein